MTSKPGSEGVGVGLGVGVGGDGEGWDISPPTPTAINSSNSSAPLYTSEFGGAISNTFLASSFAFSYCPIAK